MLIILALIVTLISGIQYTRPQVLRKLLGFKSTSGGRKDKSTEPKVYQPYYIATLYPPTVVIERDLPRFFRSYSIATDENQFAQDVVQSMIQSRNALKKGSGRQAVWLKAWDEESIQQILERNICGTDFTSLYNNPSLKLEQKQDMVMWCILTTRLADGFFMNNIQMIEGRFSPLLLTKNRGMIVRRRPPTTTTHSDNPKYMNSFYLHPRNLNDTSTALAILPSKVLNYLLDEIQSNIDDQQGRNNNNAGGDGLDIDKYRNGLQSHIYGLLNSDNVDDGMSIDDYIELTEICYPSSSTAAANQESPPDGAIAQTSSCNNAVFEENSADHIVELNDNQTDDEECCYFVFPEPESLQFKRKSKKKDVDDNDLKTLQ